MFSMNVLKYLWGEAVLTDVYLINRMLSRVLKYKTPRQSLLEIYPHTHLVSELSFRTFGCVAYVFLQPHTMSKIDYKSVKCVFLGYSNTQKGYKCYNPTTKKVFVSLDLVFDKSQPYYIKSQITKTEESEYWNLIDRVHVHNMVSKDVSDLQVSPTTLEAVQGTTLRMEDQTKTEVASERERSRSQHLKVYQRRQRNELTVQPQLQAPVPLSTQEKTGKE